MKDDNRQLLRRGLQACRLTYPEGRTSDPDSPEFLGFSEDLIRYIDEILLWNPRLGLIEGDEREIVSRHVLDSAAGLHILAYSLEYIFTHQKAGITGTVNLADLGSGSGLPGLIIALWAKHFLHSGNASAQLSVHLVEKQQRRCGFLKNAVALLGLKDSVRIHQINSAELAPGFQIITSRAYSPLDSAELKFQRSLLSEDGVILAYKGRRESLEKDLGSQLSAALHDLTGLSTGNDDLRARLQQLLSRRGDLGVSHLQVPELDGERHMLIARAV